MSADDPRLPAAVTLLGRTGAQNFRIAFSDPDDGEPTVWYACAQWPAGAEADAALSPLGAVLRLCERVIDGGQCTHCARTTIFVEDTNTTGLDSMGCVYAWDPELATFRRACEGST